MICKRKELELIYLSLDFKNITFYKLQCLKQSPKSQGSCIVVFTLLETVVCCDKVTQEDAALNHSEEAFTITKTPRQRLSQVDLVVELTRRCNEVFVAFGFAYKCI